MIAPARAPCSRPERIAPRPVLDCDDIGKGDEENEGKSGAPMRSYGYRSYVSRTGLSLGINGVSDQQFAHSESDSLRLAAGSIFGGIL